jgi:DNA ligase (NAD+)
LDLFEHAETTKDRLADEIARLRTDIQRHQDLYHRDDSPEISDEEYDGLVRRHDQIVVERPDLADETSPTLNVGGELSPLLRKVVHEVPMLSLENAFTREDVFEFDRRVSEHLGVAPGTVHYTAEPKDDGLSCSLIYEAGRLVQAATRGKNGVGEDITAQAGAVPEIPSRLNAPFPDRIEVRGEVYMTHAALASVNERHEREGRKLLANCRNAAAGAMRQQDPAETARRPLSFFAYAVAQSSDPLPPSQKSIDGELSRLGFRTNPLLAECSSVDELVSHHARIGELRGQLGYDIDGVVYKVADTALQKRLGIVSRTPRWAIAHKFAATRVETRLEGIDIQVGRTGKLTPVARLSPVSVGGVVVTNATLHNEDYITERDIRVGDRVVLQRAGDVIPQIIGCAASEHDDDRGTSYVFPIHCPECGGDAVREPEEADRRCVAGLGCPAQRKERLIHMASKSALDIDGFGEKAIEELVDAGYIREPADVFRLHLSRNEIETRNGWGRSSVGKMLDGIEARRTSPLARFIYAFGIRHVGETASKAFARRFGSLESVMAEGDRLSAIRTQRRNIAIDSGDWGGNSKVRYDRQRFELELAKSIAKDLDMDGIGPEIIGSFLDFVDDEHNRRMVDDLASQMTLTSPAAAANDSPISGKTVVFTGSLEMMGRKEAEAHAESMGARTSGSVSAKTDILVHGPGAGSKLKKAESLGVRTMTESEWFEMVGGASR